jgi:selenocysteine-specific elongation factor
VTRVLATAGHVDHGKSTLVRALTGMEPDRWAEERKRGMTIDLGYAWTTLEDGTELAFVDVPGHERFIGNMLTGLGPVPAVLFVVAADGGWSRQSAEHLAAIDALGLRHGVLAVTRSDLADPQPAIRESLDHIGQSSLGKIEAVAVSGRTGAGLPELRSALTTLVGTLPAPDVDARVRLWIDRSFSVRGSGTVVTGTLDAGTITVGDTLLLGGREVTVRSVRSLGRDRSSVPAVARVALNLRGVAVTEVGRGDVLLTQGDWHHTRTVDVRLDRTDRVPARLVLHVGTASVPVHVRPLGAQTARLTLPRELPILPGDRAVLRDPGRHAVAAGVEVLDADPPALRRRGSATARAADLAAGRPTPYQELARRGMVRRRHLESLGIAIVDPADVHEHAGWLVTDAVWRGWVAAAPDVVRHWAAAHPLDPAMPRAALARRLALPDDALVGPLAAAAELADGGGRVAGRHARPRRGRRPHARVALVRGPVPRTRTRRARRLDARPARARRRDQGAAAARPRRRHRAPARRARPRVRAAAHTPPAVHHQPGPAGPRHHPPGRDPAARVPGPHRPYRTARRPAAPDLSRRTVAHPLNCVACQVVPPSWVVYSSVRSAPIAYPSAPEVNCSPSPRTGNVAVGRQWTPPSPVT